MCVSVVILYTSKQIISFTYEKLQIHNSNCPDDNGTRVCVRTRERERERDRNKRGREGDSCTRHTALKLAEYISDNFGTCMNIYLNNFISSKSRS
jgi:hypothetical protein